MTELDDFALGFTFGAVLVGALARGVRAVVLAIAIGRAAFAGGAR